MSTDENEENQPTQEEMVSAAANKWTTFATESKFEQHPALQNDRIGTGNLHRDGPNYIPVTEQAAIQSVQSYYGKEKREKERRDAGEADDRRDRPVEDGPARRPQGSGAQSRPLKPPPERQNAPFVMPGPILTWNGNQAIPGGENLLGVPIDIANHLPTSAPTHAPPHSAANLPPPSSIPANRNPQMPAHSPPSAPLNLPPPSSTSVAANRQPQMTKSQRRAAKPPASTAFVLPGPLVSWNNSKPTPATESLAGIPVSQPPKQPSAASTASATAKTSSLPPKVPAPAPPKSAASTTPLGDDDERLGRKPDKKKLKQGSKKRTPGRKERKRNKPSASSAAASATVRSTRSSKSKAIKLNRTSTQIQPASSQAITMSQSQSPPTRQDLEETLCTAARSLLIDHKVPVADILNAISSEAQRATVKDGNRKERDDDDGSRQGDDDRDKRRRSGSGSKEEKKGELTEEKPVAEKWDPVELDADFAKTMPLAVVAVLEKTNNLSLKTLRKKVLEMYSKHPKNKLNQDQLAKRFNERLVLSLNDSTVSLKQ
ncbi:hypothetical protein HK104_003344 [Borealophlyctis nickersoniae]|nr:hypothetical protein HK104_003344 [Borealophlyctis nickersoniae]